MNRFLPGSAAALARVAGTRDVARSAGGVAFSCARLGRRPVFGERLLASVNVACTVWLRRRGIELPADVYRQAEIRRALREGGVG